MINPLLSGPELTCRKMVPRGSANDDAEQSRHDELRLNSNSDRLSDASYHRGPCMDVQEAQTTTLSRGSPYPRVVVHSQASMNMIGSHTKQNLLRGSTFNVQLKIDSTATSNYFDPQALGLHYTIHSKPGNAFFHTLCGTSDGRTGIFWAYGSHK